MEAITIGELAARSSVNLETIRYYERNGLLQKPPRSRAGYRMFPPEYVQKVRFIRHAKELGFSLKEIRELISIQTDAKARGYDVKRRVDAKVAEIDLKLESLTRMKQTLLELTASCRNQNVSVSECPILQKLNAETVHDDG